MVDHINKVIKLNNKEYPIREYRVWWLVDGKGLYTSIETALTDNQEGCRVVPVPVAVSDEIYEAV